MSEVEEGPDFVAYADPVHGRACGSCTACCTQVPVAELEKPANTRCKHLSYAKRCTIYARRPISCQYWSCRWLFDPGTVEAGMRRPDLAGYVVDCNLDDVIVGGERSVKVMQIWVDPKRRDAHRDPALRAYLSEIGRTHRLASIVRWSSDEGFVLVPPNMAREGEWLELHSHMHTADDMKTALQKVRVREEYNLVPG